MVGRLLEGRRRATQVWVEMPWVENMRELLLWVESRKGQVLEVHRRGEVLLWVIHRRVQQPLVVRKRNWVWTWALHKMKTGRTL